MIPPQKVKVKWVGAVKKYYIDRGYEFTKILDEFYVDIKDLPLKSNMYVRFICDYCNGDNQIKKEEKYAKYCNLVNHRKHTNKDCCRNCSNEKLKETLNSKAIPLEETIMIKKPELLKEWNYNKNKKEPKDYRYTHNYTDIWWQCETCSYEWKDTIYNRAYRNFKCPCCSGRVVNETNCLANTYPDIITLWNTTKNKDITPFEVTPNSSQKAWWKCDKGHEWEAVIRAVVIEGSRCPYCSGLRFSTDNSLALIKPDIASQWHPTKNGNLTPYAVSYKYYYKAWWICPDCGSEYDCKIWNRTVKNHNCPYCSGRRVNETNSLASLNPELSKEWHTTLNENKTPNDYTCFSTENIWWQCSKCNHEWQTNISQRSRGSGCPSCDSTKGEKKIIEVLTKHGLKYKIQHSYNELKGVLDGLLRFDFFINNFLIIEYDGEFHFFKVYEYDNHKNTLIHDRLKNTYCINNNIPLIRIPYWEFNNIHNIMDNVLKYFRLIESDDTCDKKLVEKYYVSDGWNQDKYLHMNDKN